MWTRHGNRHECEVCRASPNSRFKVTTKRLRELGFGESTRAVLKCNEMYACMGAHHYTWSHIGHQMQTRCDATSRNMQRRTRRTRASKYIARGCGPRTWPVRVCERTSGAKLANLAFVKCCITENTTQLSDKKTLQTNNYSFLKRVPS
jgi:hypothetical protein